MKCMKEDCQTEAKPERAYCSTVCAQTDPLRFVNDTPSGPRMASSSSREPSVPSPQSSDAELPLEENTLSNKSETQNLNPEKESAKPVATKSTKMNDAYKKRAIGKHLKQSSEVHSHELGLSEHEHPTLPLDSELPSKTLSEEGLSTMSLIDDSATHLHELMKLSTQKGVEWDVRAACEAARQMTSLLRLKLEIIKEFRK